MRAQNGQTPSEWSASGGTRTNVAPAFSPGTATLTVDENESADTNIDEPLPAATDIDGDDLIYTLEGTDAASFNFVQAQRRLKTDAALDYETKSSYAVTMKADDGYGGTATLTVTVNVTDVNEPPAAPGAPTVGPTADSTTSLDVSWTAPGNAGKPAITSYDVRYRVKEAPSWSDGPQDVTTTSAKITGLTAGTAYEVQVRASNDEGDGSWSANGEGSTDSPTNNAPSFADATETRTVAEKTDADENIGAPLPEATDSDGDDADLQAGGHGRGVVQLRGDDAAAEHEGGARPRDEVVVRGDDEGRRTATAVRRRSR